eukprot:UN30511
MTVFLENILPSHQIAPSVLKIKDCLLQNSDMLTSFDHKVIKIFDTSIHSDLLYDILLECYS